MYNDTRGGHNVKTTIIPPMTCTEPICGRKYTLYKSKITCEYFLTVADKYMVECFEKMIDEIVGKWEECPDGMFKLKLYVNLGTSHKIACAIRYALFQQSLPRYIESIIHGDRDFFKANKCLLNAQIFVRFMSCCEMFNKVECFGTVKAYTKKGCREEY